jgi:MOSC domain-containing protein YiiM
LCIWSSEVIDELTAGGHPIAPGAAGENITVTGLPWAEVRAGARLRIGDAVAEVTPYALPCAQNARWFADGDVNHMHHSRGPVSRVYALVVTPGPVAVGDTVTLEPT